MFVLRKICVICHIIIFVFKFIIAVHQNVFQIFIISIQSAHMITLHHFNFYVQILNMYTYHLMDIDFRCAVLKVRLRAIKIGFILFIGIFT